MAYQAYTPKFPLNRFVHHMYCQSGVVPYRTEKVMPAPLADLKVNFGGAFRAHRAVTGEAVSGTDAGWCMGVWDEYHTVTWPEDLDYIGVSFLPGGAYAVLGVEASELSNQIVALDALMGSKADEMRERLYLAPDSAARFALMDDLLTARIRRRPEIERIAPVIRALDESHGLIPIGEFGRMSDMSQKHLITLFNRVVGVSPKKLARLYRMQHLLNAVEGNRSVMWTHVAQDYLYFDQAHFNKDFKRHTGHAPGEYLERRRRVAAETPEHAPHIRLLPTG